jgi:hypothetical protein
MDPRTDIFILKLVYNQNVTLFGRLDNEVQRFEYLIFENIWLEFATAWKMFPSVENSSQMYMRNEMLYNSRPMLSNFGCRLISAWKIKFWGLGCIFPKYEDEKFGIKYWYVSYIVMISCKNLLTVITKTEDKSNYG